MIQNSIKELILNMHFDDSEKTVKWEGYTIYNSFSWRPFEVVMTSNHSFDLNHSLGTLKLIKFSDYISIDNTLGLVVTYASSANKIEVTLSDVGGTFADFGGVLNDLCLDIRGFLET